MAGHCVGEGYDLNGPADDLAAMGALHEAILHLGDRPDVIEWLVREGAEIEHPDASGWTPLIAAASRGYIETVRRLLQLGAEVNVSTETEGQWTPLRVAAEGGHQKVVDLLTAQGARE